MLASIARALEQRDQTLGHGARVAALAEVEHGAGTQFDPVAAELFVETWAEGWDTWHAAAAS